MTFLVQILAHTPLYVWLLLAYLVWQGAQALAPREMAVWRLLIVPVIFIAAGLVPLALQPAAGVVPILAWLAGAALLAPLGLATGPRLLGVDRAARRVRLAGSALPLLRNLLVFALQYGLAVALALHPGAPTLAAATRAVSGASAGYFLAWMASLARRYRAAAATVA